MIAIQTANLTKKYGDIIAINGVDLEVEAGEIVASARKDPAKRRCCAF